MSGGRPLFGRLGRPEGGTGGQRGPRAAPPLPPRSRSDRQRGSVSIEFIGFLPVLLILALAAVQLGIAAYAASQAGTAARAAARMASQDDPPQSGEAAGEQAVSDWIDATFTGGADGDHASYTVTVKIPSLFPGIGFGSVTRSSTMPRSEEAP